MRRIRTPDTGFFACRGGEGFREAEITEFATVRELIARGLGIALLPISSTAFPMTVEVPLTGSGHNRTIALAWASKTRTPAAQRLGSFIQGRGLKTNS